MLKLQLKKVEKEVKANKDYDFLDKKKTFNIKKTIEKIAFVLTLVVFAEGFYAIQLTDNKFSDHYYEENLHKINMFYYEKSYKDSYVIEMFSKIVNLDFKNEEYINVLIGVNLVDKFVLRTKELYISNKIKKETYDKVMSGYKKIIPEMEKIKEEKFKIYEKINNRSPLLNLLNFIKKGNSGYSFNENINMKDYHREYKKLIEENQNNEYLKMNQELKEDFLLKEKLYFNYRNSLK